GKYTPRPARGPSQRPMLSAYGKTDAGWVNPGKLAGGGAGGGIFAGISKLSGFGRRLFGCRLALHEHTAFRTIPGAASLCLAPHAGIQNGGPVAGGGCGRIA